MAFFGFLGCLVLIGIASHSSSGLRCKEEWKQEFSVKAEAEESLVEAHTHNNSYELSWAGKIFKHSIDW